MAGRLAAMHRERREAAEEALAGDLQAALEYLALLTDKLLDGQYDRDYGPELRVASRGRSRGRAPQRRAEAAGGLRHAALRVRRRGRLRPPRRRRPHRPRAARPR